MNNINSHNISENITKKNILGILPYPILLVALLSINNPSKANITRNSNNYNQSITEIILDSTIISNIEKRTGVSLPQEYSNIINDFVTNNEVMKNNNATNFTEEFIVDQMKSDWGINKENQLLFIRDAIYEEITNENFYDGNDGNDNRLAEFEKVIDNLENCGIKYRDSFITYMEGISAEARQQSAEARQQSAEARQQSAEARQQSAEARQQSAEARQQSAEARQQSAEADIRYNETKYEAMKADTIGLKEIVRFYTMNTEHPNLIKNEEIDQVTITAKSIIKNCKINGIDYKAVLLQETGDRRKVETILRFYGIEG